MSIKKPNNCVKRDRRAYQFFGGNSMFIASAKLAANAITELLCRTNLAVAKLCAILLFKTVICRIDTKYAKEVISNRAVTFA